MSPSSSPRSVSGTAMSFLPAARSAIVRVRPLTGRAINRVSITASVMAMPINASAPSTRTNNADLIAVSWLAPFSSINLVCASLISRSGSTAALVSTALPAARTSASAASRWPALTLAINRSPQSLRHASVSSRDLSKAAFSPGSTSIPSSSAEALS
jgi:hypothetical protein